MRTGKPAVCLLMATLSLAIALLGGEAALAATSDDATNGKDLSNASCLSCHDGQKGKIEVTDAEGEERTLHDVDPARFGKSAHAYLECINCHRDIADTATPHRKVPGEKRPDCAECHLQLAKDPATNFKTAGERRALRIVVRNIEAYKTSFHAEESYDDPNRPHASCNDCHNVHSFDIPTRGTQARAEWRLGVSEVCASCHDEQHEEWAESAHGRAVIEKNNAESANCDDCHGSHAVSKPRLSAIKLEITSKCGNCHEDAYQSYRSTYHGQVATLGFSHTAKCFDCHGSHAVEPSDNPDSTMHLDNRLDTCQDCHSGRRDIPLATAGFVSFSPHGTTDDFSSHPQIWLAHKLMIGLLLGTFSFFWVHTLLWFHREYKERKQRGSQPHVRTEGLTDVPARFQGKQFLRFGRTWRLAHLVFALSLMMLTLTGIPLFYPEAPWAKPLVNLLGGVQMAGDIHRVNAVIFAGVFLAHLVYVAIHLWRIRKTFEIFGPNSLIPGLQDLKDIIAMFKWFVGLAPRPVFDRWTYWEKFDYWAPFWGVTIIGFSGLMLWIPHVIAQYLPGWVFNVATIFHSEEAFLAVVFLFTVHFFNNHFRPDKFPLDRVMFTGRITLEEFMHEHPLQYKRMLESGELEKHLVDPPSPAFHKASTMLGFTLILLGLTLLTLVGIGFFTSL